MTYTAITIGPICKTLSKARNTKSFWSASFIFSWIMRELLGRISEKYGKEIILSPHYSSDTNAPKGVGLFPDRAFIKGEVTDFDDIKRRVLEDLAQKFEGVKDIEAYLQEYISISHVRIEYQDQTEIFTKLNQYLDTQELRQRAVTFSSDHISDFIQRNNAFIEEEFEGRPFDSISEIAVSGWLTRDETRKYLNGEQEVDYRRISQEKREDFLNCYKYMAIVKADGDNFGSFIKGLSPKEMGTFSEKFFNFSTDVAEKFKPAKEAKVAKAVPIYIGGDDLFFFAPILRDGKDDVFDLINEVDDCFKSFRSELSNAGDLSMSYGVSIFYYKSPMSEAMDVATKMLFDKAKGYEGKDRVAVSIRKHSGKTIEFALPCKETANRTQGNGPSLYNEARRLMKDLREDGAMIEGFIHWLGEMYDAVIAPILDMQMPDEMKKIRLSALCKNFFDEEIHQEEKARKFMGEVFDFLYLTSSEKETPRWDHEERKKLLYGILRYCQFVTDKEER